MAYLYGIWACFIVFGVSALYRLIVVKRIRAELTSQAGALPGGKIDEKTVLINLLKQDKARFPVSSTRSFSSALLAVQMVASAGGMVLLIAAQFQPHSMFHLISAAR